MPETTATVSTTTVSTTAGIVAGAGIAHQPYPGRGRRYEPGDPRLGGLPAWPAHAIPGLLCTRRQLHAHGRRPGGAAPCGLLFWTGPHGRARYAHLYEFTHTRHRRLRLPRPLRARLARVRPLRASRVMTWPADPSNAAPANLRTRSQWATHGLRPDRHTPCGLVFWAGRYGTRTARLYAGPARRNPTGPTVTAPVTGLAAPVTAGPGAPVTGIHTHLHDQAHDQAQAQGRRRPRLPGWWGA